MERTIDVKALALGLGIGRAAPVLEMGHRWKVVELGALRASFIIPAGSRLGARRSPGRSARINALQ